MKCCRRTLFAFMHVTLLSLKVLLIQHIFSQISFFSCSSLFYIPAIFITMLAFKPFLLSIIIVYSRIFRLFIHSAAISLPFFHLRILIRLLTTKHGFILFQLTTLAHTSNVNEKTKKKRNAHEIKRIHYNHQFTDAVARLKIKFQMDTQDKN